MRISWSTSATHSLCFWRRKRENVTRAQCKIAAYVLSSVVFTLLLQGVPLVTLAPREYGYVSLIQLVIVLSNTLFLSLINEADGRFEERTGIRSTWPERSAAILMLAGGAALATLLLSCVISPLRPNAIMWSALVGLSIYLGSASYFLMRDSRIERLIVGRICGASLMGGMALALYSKMENLSISVVALVQLSGVGLAVLFTRRPTLSYIRGTRSWFRERKAEARTLLIDGSLQDLGSFWAPNAIALLLGVASLGIYRAAITAASPISLLITPLRPLIASRPLSSVVAPARLGGLWLCGLAMGGSAALGLALIGELRVEVGSLTALNPYGAPIGLYVAGSAVSHLQAVMARIYLPGRWLLRGRILQGGLLGIVPVSGAALFGLSGALWGLGIGSVAVGLIWSTLLHRQLAAGRTESLVK